MRIRVNGGAWRPMAFTPQVDPSIAWVLEEEKTATPWLGSKYNPDDKPSVAHHMWEAPLPAGMAGGTHTLEVESTDMFGQRDAKATFFRISQA